jgi:hypothetical protein
LPCPASPTLVRPALGEAASLGALYDARTDSFVQLSVIKNRPSPKAITTTDNYDSDIKYINHDSFKDKFSSLDIGAQLGASFLAGLVSRRLRKISLGTMRHQSRGPTILDLQHQDCKREAGVSDISWEAVDTGAATHVVSEIIWGSRNIMTASRHSPTRTKPKLLMELWTLVSTFGDPSSCLDKGKVPFLTRIKAPMSSKAGVVPDAEGQR